MGYYLAEPLSRAKRPARGFRTSVPERSGHLSVDIEKRLDRQNLDEIALDWKVTGDVCDGWMDSFSAQGSDFQTGNRVEREMFSFSTSSHVSESSS